MALFLFDTSLTPAQFTLPNNQELSLALGRVTIVHMTATQSLTFVGLFATGGNIDGMVVHFSNVNNNSFVMSFAHESGSASAAGNRFRNASSTTADGGSGAGGVLYRYNGTALRWVELGKT